MLIAKVSGIENSGLVDKGSINKCAYTPRFLEIKMKNNYSHEFYPLKPEDCIGTARCQGKAVFFIEMYQGSNIEQYIFLVEEIVRVKYNYKHW
jgi:hypothetical protein